MGNPGGVQAPVLVNDERMNVESIESAHEKIHDSKSYTVSYANAVTNINEQTAIFWRCNSVDMHLVITVQASKDTTVSFYENPNPVAAGGTLTPTSRNRATLGTPSVYSYGTAAGKMNFYTETQAAAGSFTTTGLLDTYFLAGGEGPRSFGAQGFRDAQEFVVGGTANYAVVMNANTADDDTHYIRIDWYEN
jgi:hypothetical protein